MLTSTTLFLSQHNDADFILAILSGRDILTMLNPNNRNSFNLEHGDTIKLPAGTICLFGKPRRQQRSKSIRSRHSLGENQRSFLSGFSKNILEASFNAHYEDIEKILIEEQEKGSQHRRDIRDRRRQQSQEANLQKSVSSEYEPFNLGNYDPIYSNKFDNFFEITPEKNPQLKDLNVLVNAVEIKEGSLLLPHYNSRSTVIVAAIEGKGEFELVSQRNENQQEQRDEDEEEEEDEQERSKQVQRYRARLSPGDIFVIPAGEEDNVISQIHRPVKELAFPGSAQLVDRLLKNQKQSYFVNTQPQQREEERPRKRDPVSSILGTF
ncbi:convicilin [Trifolium pratense]|uniref:Convicilin n=1 Tax=Trifolium pratense TaxID=57577 RepID=A0A2K3NXW9_TRIPR|nr:convicilin [Trifolium pratense]